MTTFLSSMLRVFAKRLYGVNLATIPVAKWVWEFVHVHVLRTEDEYCVHNNIQRVDFLKIDVEGSEEKVFLGMQKTLAANPDIKFVMEFIPGYLKAAGTDPVAFLNKVIGLGFKLYDIRDEGLLALPTGSFAAEVYDRQQRGMNIVCTREVLS
jgi:hypothetical protein